MWFITISSGTTFMWETETSTLGNGFTRKSPKWYCPKLMIGRKWTSLTSPNRCPRSKASSRRLNDLDKFYYKA